MDLDMAKQLLGSCVKYENRDHAFGDMEVEWYDGEINLASGYFGGGNESVTMLSEPRTFEGSAARELLGCFLSEHKDRNDSTGPDEFEIGKVMPGLTKEGILKELRGE